MGSSRCQAARVALWKALFAILSSPGRQSIPTPMNDAFVRCPIMSGLCRAPRSDAAQSPAGPFSRWWMPSSRSRSPAGPRRRSWAGSGQGGPEPPGAGHRREPAAPAAGPSKAKARASGSWPASRLDGGLRGLNRLHDEAIVARLIAVKGIGVWTAEMFLLFTLQRPDVWPIGDGGVQRAAAQLYGVTDPKALPR